MVFFEGSKVNVPQVAIFDKNMAVGKSKNLVMLHVYKLEKDHTTFIYTQYLFIRNALIRNNAEISGNFKKPAFKG